MEADEPPVPDPVDRCEDAEAGGLEFPAALITTMVAMAATTRATGTSAVITGWRERNRAGGAWAPVRDWVRAWDLDDALDLGPGRVVGAFFLVLFVVVSVVGRGRRDGPDGDFDMVFLLGLGEHGDRAHVLEGSKWRPRSGFLD